MCSVAGLSLNARVLRDRVVEAADRVVVAADVLRCVPASVVRCIRRVRTRPVDRAAAVLVLASVLASVASVLVAHRVCYRPRVR